MQKLKLSVISIYFLANDALQSGYVNLCILLFCRLFSPVREVLAANFAIDNKANPCIMEICFKVSILEKFLTIILIGKMCMSSDAYLQIKLKYNTFTAAHKKLADFMLDNPEFVLSKSITEVADACNVGEATISRFCKVVGFNGYHDFKLSIVRHLSKDQPDGSLSSAITKDDSISTVVKFILNKNIEALTETCNLIHEDDLSKAVDLLSSADRIMFFGVGSSLAAALDGCNKFMRITPKASINIETHMQYASAALMSDKDVAIIISYSGSTKEIVDIAKTAKKRGTKIICITRYLKSPLTQYSDISLLCSSNERTVHGYSLSMELTQMFMLDILYTEFVRRNHEKALENKEASSSILSDKLF